MPALAVTTLLHDRATARARCPTRGVVVDGAMGGACEAGHAQHGEARRRIPAGQLRVERAAIVAADTEAVFAAERADRRQHHVVSVHESAGRSPPALHLDDGGRGGATASAS